MQQPESTGPLPEAIQGKFRFGLFELDGTTYELKKSGRVIPLRPQPAKVLGYLVTHAGDLVLREDLRRHIWGNTFVDAEAGLNACVRDIRAVLGDRANAPTYIETVPRRGYRFIAPMQAPAPAVSVDEPVPQSGVDPEREVGRGRVWLSAAVVVIVLGALIFALGLMRSPDAESQELSAVDPEAHEAILEAQYLLERGERGDAEGAVERARRATEVAPTWGDAFVVLGDALFKLPGPPRERMPAARTAYRQALHSDPTLADAHLGLAAVHGLYDWDLAAASRELERAEQLGGETSDLHQSWAMIHLVAGRTKEALVHLQRALRLDPVSARIRGDIGWVYALSGDHHQAIKQCRRGLDLEPNAAWLHGCLVEAYRELGDLESAATAALAEMRARHANPVELERLETDPTGVLAALDQFRLQRLLAARDERYIPSCAIGIRYAQAGDPGQALRYLELAYEERSAFMPFLELDLHLAALHDDPRFRRLADRVAGEMRPVGASRS